MSWQSPEYVEIKMDAEIGSYQEDDFDPRPGPDETRAATENPPAQREPR